jgi:hypothetical protein
LDEFSSYLESLAGKEMTFDAAHLNNIIDSFAPALNNHLESELQSLLGLSKYGDKLPITRLWDREGFRSVVSIRPKDLRDRLLESFPLIFETL